MEKGNSALKGKKLDFEQIKKNGIKETLNHYKFIPKKNFLSYKYLVLYIIVLTMILVGDQITKQIISTTIKERDGIAIIQDFFYFTYTKNFGGAWSILEGQMWLFYIVTVIAIVSIYHYFIQTKKHEELTRFGLVLVLAGALGNFIDRLLFGYVRDFIHFQFKSFEFPIFNIADIAITIGIMFVLFEIVMEEYKIWKLSK